jgi:RNA polymerase sigma-70 factor (ECF subfamily)
MTTRTDAVTHARAKAADVAGRAATLLDERTFHVLYGRTAAPLRAYVARTMGRADHADDIVQETFLRLLRTPLATRDLDELRAYAFRVASHLVVDHWRARKHESPAPIAEPATHDPDQGLRVDVGRLFARLKPRERQLVWLAHVEQANHQEIADALGLRPRSIRVLLSRARAKLAALLRAHGHGRESDR